MSTLRPTRGRVLVRMDKRTSHYGLIELPDSFRKQPVWATVVAVGIPLVQPDGRVIDSMLTKGDRVYMGPWNGLEVTWEGMPTDGEYRMCSGFENEFADIYVAEHE